MVTEILSPIPSDYYLVPYLNVFVSLSAAREVIIAIALMTCISVFVYGCVKSKWVTKKNFWRTFDFLFPAGNHRYYFWYLPSILVIWVTLLLWIIGLNLLLRGNWISTDTFVTHITSASSVPEWVENIIAQLMELAGYLWVVFTIHTLISFIIDTGYSVGSPILKNRGRK